MKRFFKIVIISIFVSGIFEFINYNALMNLSLSLNIQDNEERKETSLEWGVRVGTEMNAPLVFIIYDKEAYASANALIHSDNKEIGELGVGAILGREIVFNSTSNVSISLIAHELGHCYQVIKGSIVSYCSKAREYYNIYVGVPMTRWMYIKGFSSITDIVIFYWATILMSVILLSMRCKLLTVLINLGYLMAWVVCLVTEADATYWAVTHVPPECISTSIKVLTTAFTTYASLAFGPVMVYAAIRNK